MGKPNVEKMQANKDIEGLIKALKDNGWYVRSGAPYVLGKIGDEKAVEPLIEALKDKDGDVLREATEALEKIKAQRSKK